MMDDYFPPDPDDEFELMHGDELDVLNEFDQENFEPPVSKCQPKSKRSLNFSSPTEKGVKIISSPSKKHLVEKVTNHYETDNDISVISDNNEDASNVIPSLPNQQSESAKRKVADLFGDIDDIDFEDESLNSRSKRSKPAVEIEAEVVLTDEQRMDITIQKILAARQQSKEENCQMLSYESHDSFKAAYELEITRKVPNYQSISMLLPYENKIYLRFRTETLFDLEVDEVFKRVKSGSLLNVPFKDIQEEAAILLQKKLDAVEKESVLDIASETLKENHIKNTGELLWVEKYKPRKYLDLLSDEGTNKSLLRWLKMWDKVVFDREVKIKINPKYEEQNHFGSKFKTKTPHVNIYEFDELGRPKYKIALLCGPPGLGKTTLAHIVARHAGYNVVEVNASDDRSPEMFRTQLLAATQMKAVLGRDPRPNCLILDEIDGAPQASVDLLIKFATAKEPMKMNKGGKKKKTDMSGVLKRPIICICNDVYSIALKPLRQSAFVLHFPSTCSYRLGQRLCEISRMQNLKTDISTMIALSEKTNNDIRSCLAILHWLQAKSGNVIRLAQVNDAAIGMKDIQKGLFTVWQEIFQIKNNDRWKSVLKTVRGFGDYDKLAQGVYENYHTVRLKGPSLKLISEGLDWFCYYDIMSNAIHTSQNYTIYSYLPYPFIKWHYLFAGRLWPKLSFPSLIPEMNTRKTKTRGIIEEMFQGMSPNIRSHERRETLLLDVLALLLDIIVPNLRQVNVQLYNDEEKKELQKVVNIMLDYNLCYIQERSQDGNFNFKLTPYIEEVAKFPGSQSNRSLGYTDKLQIQRAVDLEKVKRMEPKIINSKNNLEHIENRETKKFKPVTEQNQKPNHLQKLTPKALKAVESVSRDFFGRVVEKQSIIGNGGLVPGKDIWLRFKEGYNNAVRRHIKIKDLL